MLWKLASSHPATAFKCISKIVERRGQIQHNTAPVAEEPAVHALEKDTLNHQKTEEQSHQTPLAGFFDYTLTSGSAYVRQGMRGAIQTQTLPMTINLGPHLLEVPISASAVATAASKAGQVASHPDAAATNKPTAASGASNPTRDPRRKTAHNEKAKEGRQGGENAAPVERKEIQDQQDRRDERYCPYTTLIALTLHCLQVQSTGSTGTRV